MRLPKILLLWLVACAPAAPVAVARTGALADSRASFQALLDSGRLDLRGKPGRYEVSMPPAGRPFASLRMPDGAEIIGDGPATTTIALVGDPGGRDWCGVRPGSHWRIGGVTLEVDAPGGTWGEQSHLICLRGPATGGELHDAVLIHPVVVGSSRGDCIQFVGYPPDATTGATDQRIWDQHVHHVVFRHCARSGVAIHSGLHGRMLPPDDAGEIHSSTRFDHNSFEDTSDQDLDEEGTGDVGGIEASDVVEWDHNTHLAGASSQSALAISIYPGSTHLHHNTIIGRGVDVMGGSHELDHNTVTLTVPNGGDPMIYRRKAGTTYVHDETWTRAASAGPGPMFVAAQKISAPTGVRLEDVKMFQETASTSIGAQGIVGLSLRSVTLVDTGAPGTRDAIRIEGTAGSSGVQSTGIFITDSTLSGIFRSAVSVSGSYSGIGSIVIRGNSSPGASRGMSCETPTGVAGPISYSNNAMPGGPCAP